MHVPTTNRPLREKFTERFVRCATGLTFFGIGIACFVRSRLGVPPWDVFHQGLSEHTGIRMGTMIIIVGMFLLLLWIPLRQIPGIGTIMNAVQIGLVENVAQDLLPSVDNMALRIAYLALGMALIAVGSGIYIGAELGTGPRDGLMVGLNRRFGISVRLARTIIEVIVMVIGVFLGGTMSYGTFVFAFGIGPLVQIALPAFRMPPSLVTAAREEAHEQ